MLERSDTVTEILHDRPAADVNEFKPLYKFYRRLGWAKFNHHCQFPQSGKEYATLLDPYNVSAYESLHANDLNVTVIKSIKDHASSCCEFIAKSPSSINSANQDQIKTEIVEITVNSVPGLRIYPGIYSPNVQRQLILNCIEEYLPPSTFHLTNLHPAYDLPDPFNLFGESPQTLILPSKNPSTAASTPTTLAATQSKKLRWVTLGGQYNWTTKEYPTFTPRAIGFPDFPDDLVALLAGSSITCQDKGINPEASIINFYSDGDILSPHQDVAERSSADLVSISIGCEAVFFVGLSKDSLPLQLRVRSGDVIVMGGQSRFAWHGVGRVWHNTAPSYLTDFDFLNGFKDDDNLKENVKAGRQHYGSWISSKRINFNARQML
ncbi:hypothetical protein V1514DRAFT_337818 [Lipomyces japonicus]|uniref:uncharacterized protein n=1 Tax=Lipomyces japonicus TaxID=56871 RepID=UPI0034CD9094